MYCPRTPIPSQLAAPPRCGTAARRRASPPCQIPTYVDCRAGLTIACGSNRSCIIISFSARDSPSTPAAGAPGWTNRDHFRLLDSSAILLRPGSYVSSVLVFFSTATVLLLLLIVSCHPSSSVTVTAEPGSGFGLGTLQYYVSDPSLCYYRAAVASRTHSLFSSTCPSSPFNTTSNTLVP